MAKNIKWIAAVLSACLVLTGCGTNAENQAPEAADVAEVVETVTEAEDTNTEVTDTSTETTDGNTEAAADDSSSEEVPILRDAVKEKLGGGFVGCAVTGSEIDDEKVWEIITTHFEAVTLGNELKPDALFNYSVSICPGTTTSELNGEELEVPVLNYSRAEKILDKIYDWNQENPDRQIKVRGHVLVWHSQTPEWFFHEDYNKTKPYVDSATMNKRLEWYIREVLTHFTGEDSKYKDMFYGWDVVNEAISDGTGDLRTDNENPNESLSEDRHGSNSSWWHIYQSNEFIINAFKYANKYAPAELELYYNDYNECVLQKKLGIIELLQAIKDNEGEPGVGTRITAMGMQGHYGMDSPNSTDITASATQYANVVGKVQITELDVSASSDYDGSEEMKEDEYEKLRKKYSQIYFGINAANARDGVEITGITFWGTVDQYSWLQSRSNVGGGNTTGLPQCPLLFDENYEPKSCFYVFANN